MPALSSGRARAVLAAVVLAALVLAGCSTPGPVKMPTGPVGADSAPVPALESYYGQHLAWATCHGQFECADLIVPLDYAKPGKKDITIKVLRYPARDQGKRIGSLVVNPGGPGGSGVEYAQAPEAVAGPSVLNYFDLVGFDPRGVGESTPVDCLDDRALDTFLGTDPTPDDRAQEVALQDEGKTMAAGCEAKSGPMLPHMSTEDAARDMDVLRAALGDARLTYLGKSYGTFLGATYAELFPQRVGRFVLDGVVPPDLTNAELSEGQARGFELATRAYVKDCIDDAGKGGCLLGSTVDEGMQWIRDFLKDLDAEPIRSGDPAVPDLNEAWASLGMAAALYDQGTWALLTDALTKAKAGDGSELMQLADAYARRTRGGTYTSNIMEVIYAVNCLDRPDSPDLSTYRRQAKQFEKVAPTWGEFLAWGSVTCGVWPVKGGPGPHTIAAKGAGPIVVVGTTRDPATIYEWSVRLRDQLSDAVLVTYDGDGHTAYRRSNDCVDDAIDAYYVQGTVPKDGLTC
ncbi:MAG: alpha/beta hydrolase [Micrococcales bacterium]|nr:alpha/beta hydrolase [Micrococcales bacterium]